MSKSNITTALFIQKAINVHGNKYDYSKVEYMNMKTRIIIICNEHGKFEQIPQSHLRGKGCKKCGILSSINILRSDTESFIEKAKNIHGDKYDYDKTIYKKSHEKVIITCKLHGDFEQMPYGHLRTTGCKKCSFINISNKLRGNTTEFIDKAKEIHMDKYDYSNVNYTDLQTKVIIICDKHQEFEQTPAHHLQGYGCPKCYGNEKMTTEEFIRRSKELYGNKYDYSKVEYVNMTTKVTIICNKYGEFEQRPDCHLRGYECTKYAEHTNFLTHNFIEKVKRVHGDTYDYSKVEYINSDTKVIIICDEHGEFKQRPDRHLSGSGCTKCFGCVKLTTDEFIKKAGKVHNNKYDYSKTVYTLSKNKIVIFCKLHGDFEQTANSHLAGNGCPKCLLCPKCQLFRTNGQTCQVCNLLCTKKSYQKTKELEVVKFLKDNLPDNDFIHNKSVGSNCTDKHIFPDILFDCGNYNLIVEVDEHKHRGSSYSCDEARMYDIIAKTGLPCIFIRYNPDSKNSDKNILLDKVKKYLILNNKIWDDFGFKVEYLFY